MRKFLCLLIAVLFFFLTGSLYAFEIKASKHVLDNGLTVLTTQMPSSPVVSVYGLVKTGEATEGKFLGTGISHFLEHMVFKGTHERGAGELAARIQAVGGMINASTGMDYTVYTITVPGKSFDTALSVLSDMLTNAAMDPDEVEKERNVIFSEMRMREDNPDAKIGEWTFQNVYLRHPYRYPVIGYKSLLAGVTREDLLHYYRERYVPNNMIISVAGNIDEAQAYAKIKETFGGLKRRAPVVRNLPAEPRQISARSYQQEYPTDLARLSMAFSGVELLHPDLYALDVLARILGQGESSRLYLKVYKEKGLVYSVSAWNYTPIDRGIFQISCLLEGENTQAASRAVLDEIEDIKKKGVKPEELAKAKQQVQSEYVFDHKTSASVAYSQAVDEAFAGDPGFSREYVNGIKRVTLEDIKRVADQYLIETALTTVVLQPKKEKPEGKEEAETPAEGHIEKHVLDNGLTVLLKTDRTFPVVDIQLAANGGVREEPVELNGLFHLLASTWTKGTKKDSARDIAEKTESLGMSLSGFSGKNSFGLTMECLSDQWRTAFSVLKDLVADPVFPPGEIDKAKDQMKASIRERENNIFLQTAHTLKQTLFLSHPFRLEDEGSAASVDRLTRKDLTDLYKKYLVPGNMVLSVFGDIDAQKVLDRIKKDFGGLPEGEVSLKSYAEPPLQKPREKTMTMDKEQAMAMLGFQGVSFHDKDVYGLDVLSAILGSSFNGRLFNNIREQSGDAYTLGGNFLPGPDTGFVYFYVLTAKEKVDKVKELLKENIAAMQSEKVSGQELKDTQTYLKGTFEASLETQAALSFVASLDELYGLGFDHYRGYEKGIDAVTPGDIQRLAREYLDLDKAAVVITLPESASP